MKISVVIPTYNRKKTLKRAIDSVLAQTLQASQIIIVDDGSTDDTPSLLKKYPQITIISQKNRGVSHARNKGIEAASHEWIAFLDSDDEWHEEKLLKQSAFHTQHPEHKLSYTNEKWMKDGKELKQSKRHRKQKNPTFSSSLGHCQIGPSTVMVHSSVFEQLGYFDEELEVCEDYDLWLRILKVYEIPLIEDIMTIKHAGSEDQLSIKYWALERWHVISLLKHVDDDEVRDEIVRKCEGLKKAALKYGDKILLNECEQRLKSLK